MPSESAITQMMEIFTEVIDLGGVEERTAVVPNLSVTDAAPTGLTGFVIVQDDRDGDNILAKTVPGVVYANNDKVNVLFIRGTEPIAFQQGSQSTNAGLWQIVPSTSTDIFYNNGNVGIGVATPASQLDVSGDVLLSGGLQNYLFTDRSSTLILQSRTAATAFALEMFPLDGDGTDDNNFSLYAIGAPSDITNRERLLIKYEATGTRFEIFSEADGTGTLRPLIVYTEGNSSQVYLETDGNVGIGIAPSTKLHIRASGEHLRLDDSSATGNPFLTFFQSGTRRSFIQHNDSNNNLILASEFGRLTLKTGSAGSEQTRVTVGTGGNVGIGIVAALGQLHVDQPSATGAEPVIFLDQADISEEFIKFQGAAAAATLTQSIVAEADVTTATRQGFIKIEIEDVGNQVTDQAYFVPFFTLA